MEKDADFIYIVIYVLLDYNKTESNIYFGLIVMFLKIQNHSTVLFLLIFIETPRIVLNNTLLYNITAANL